MIAFPLVTIIAGNIFSIAHPYCQINFLTLLCLHLYNYVAFSQGNCCGLKAMCSIVNTYHAYGFPGVLQLLIGMLIIVINSDP